MEWSMEVGLLSRESSQWMRERYRGYQQGKVSELAICGEMVQVYHGLRDSEMRAAADKFFGLYIAPRVFPVMRQLCLELKAAGTTVWAVSSTNAWAIQAAMPHFGIDPDHVRAACVRIVNGTVTDELIDVPTDEGKAVTLKRTGIHVPSAVFGNTLHDAAMLAMAQHAFAIAPSPELAQLAAANGWLVFRPDVPTRPGGAQQ